MTTKYTTKADLAMAYYPDTPVSLALKSLRRQIVHTRGLEAALAEAGYRKHSHRFTPLQVEIICRYLGEP